MILAESTFAAAAETQGAGNVAIVMSTFNGARFLGEQLDSFTTQTGVDWTLHWRDDGSADETPDIVRRFALTRPRGQVEEVPGSGQKLGVFDSFLTGLGAALAGGADAFAFADQDDVWLPDKLQRAMAFLATVQPRRPAVYCARQRLVDDALRPLGYSPAFRAVGIPGLVLQNIGTGCALVMNRAAAEAVHQSAKPSRSMHDWWACMYVAAIGGAVFFDPTPVILYRQHGGNLIGAGQSRWERAKGALARGAGSHNRQLADHVSALLRNRSHLTPDTLQVLERISRGSDGGLFARLGLLRIPGFRRQTALETALLAIWLFLGTRDEPVNTVER